MKKFMINAFATTGISLIMLSFVALAFHAKCIYLETVFQIFVVNVLSHLLIILIRKMDFRSNFLEMTLELISLESELLIFGWLFHWFTSVSVAILVIMGGDDICHITIFEFITDEASGKGNQFSDSKAADAINQVLWQSVFKGEDKMEKEE